MRLRVSELKKFLEKLPEDGDVFVDSYDGSHHREFLFVRSYQNGRAEDTEIQVAKTDLQDN